MSRLLRIVDMAQNYNISTPRNSFILSLFQKRVLYKRVLCTTLKACAVWFLITLLKGEAYSCSYWPDANQLCPGTNQTYVEPCQQPKTIETKLDTCDAKMARNLKAQSHMIGWCLVFCKLTSLE